MIIRLIQFIIALFMLSNSLGQVDFSGVWQGVMIRDGFNISKGNPVYYKFDGTNDDIVGYARNEVYMSETFAVKKFNARIEKKQITIKELAIIKRKMTSKVSWCKIDAVLKYNDSTGYLEGRYNSTDCKHNNGKIILYKTDVPFAMDEEQDIPHHWFDVFIKDYQKGLSSPMKRDEERKNFKFVPVYFDYDEAFIRPEYQSFLLSVIKIVEGHSDLRVKVTGNTDSDGSDHYNEGLSERRAKAIIDFFVQHGIERDRLEIDFKGEKNPIDTNDTPEGKQKNRRVDFSFI